MHPIEVLMNEHRLIESVLASFDAFVDRLGPDSSMGVADTGRFTQFIRGIADTCHHAEEEDILFEAMVRTGIPRHSGPIAVMVDGHEQGRQLIGKMADCAARTATSGWNEHERQCLRRAAHTVTDLLRRHIQKEDGTLFPMASSQLDSTAMSEVAGRFEAFELEETGKGSTRRCTSRPGI